MVLRPPVVLVLVLVLVERVLLELVLARLGLARGAGVAGLAGVVPFRVTVCAVGSLQLAQRGGAGPRHATPSATGEQTMSR